MTNSEAHDATEQKPAPAPPKFISSRPRSHLIELEHPIEYDGKEIHFVTVRRLQARELEDFVEAVRNGSAPSLPMIDVPGVVLDSLDADDYEKVNRAISDFLPRTLRQDE